MTHQRQTESAALRVVHERIAGSIKLLKDSRLLVSFDADATIANFEFKHTLIAIKPDSQEFFTVRILQCIVNQIHQRACDRFANVGIERGDLDSLRQRFVRSIGGGRETPRGSDPSTGLYVDGVESPISAADVAIPGTSGSGGTTATGRRPATCRRSSAPGPRRSPPARTDGSGTVAVECEGGSGRARGAGKGSKARGASLSAESPAGAIRSWSALGRGCASDPDAEPIEGGLGESGVFADFRSAAGQRLYDGYVGVGLDGR